VHACLRPAEAAIALLVFRDIGAVEYRNPANQEGTWVGEGLRLAHFGAIAVAGHPRGSARQSARHGHAAARYSGWHGVQRRGVLGRFVQRVNAEELGAGEGAGAEIAREDP
jgi:hypothetical protein